MSSRPTTDELIERYADEPAPLLPILHALHDRDGTLFEDSLRAVSEALRIPLADLYGTVTFYHHFSMTPHGHQRARVCDGPVCRLRGSDAVIAANDAEAMPCSGRCDAPIPVLVGNQTFVADDKGALHGVDASAPTPLPPPSATDDEECVFAHIREPQRATLDGYRRTAGYHALEATLKNRRPADIVDLITASGLRGRGGAGFPTGQKWKAVAEEMRGPKTVVCNADEGEPGCFKDRALMDYDPHALIEGMLIAAYATGAERGFIYLRYEYPETLHILERAIDEATRAGLLGDNIQGTGFSFALFIRRGAGAYICGEETSLLNSLEGKHPFPRNRPPYPVTHGFEDLPTAVNNVETLCSVAPIVAHGADWYQGLGRGEHAGTKVISLSGDIARPGNYEVPIGYPLKDLLHTLAGGPLAGRVIQAVTQAGLSGGFIAGEDLDVVTLDEPSLRSKGSFLGAGGIMVFDDTRDMRDVAAHGMSFFAHESCGKCFPCRIGTQRLTERLKGGGPKQDEAWREEIVTIGKTMKATSACGLGIAAPLLAESWLRYFPEDAQ